MGQADGKYLRMCVGCGQKLPKSRMLRIVGLSDGTTSIDPSGKTAGRGAYVCSPACLGKACATRRFDRALKRKVSKLDYERMEAQAADAFTDIEM